eukprot:3098875-Ditylum_brightwellii.AAC.1
MEFFPRKTYFQANIHVGDDNDNLDNKLQKLSEAERELHDEKKCSVAPRQNEGILLQAGNANFILMLVHNNEDSDTTSLEMSDLDYSNHTFSSIKKKLYSNSKNTASDDMMKIKHHSSSFNAHSKSDKSDNN